MVNILKSTCTGFPRSLTASNRWTSWVWEITGESSRLEEITHHFRGIHGMYLKKKKAGRSHHISGLGNTRTWYNRDVVVMTCFQVTNDQGKPTISYRWTGWSSRLQKNTRHFRTLCEIYLKSIKKNRRISTCNRLDLQTLGSQPIMPKNSPITGSSQFSLFIGPPSPHFLPLSSHSPSQKLDHLIEWFWVELHYSTNFRNHPRQWWRLLAHQST